MRIAAGSAEYDAGERFVHPGARVRYLAQDADFGAFASQQSNRALSDGPGRSQDQSGSAVERDMAGRDSLSRSPEKRWRLFCASTAKNDSLA